MIFEAILSVLTDEPLEDLGTMRKTIKREFAEYKKIIISQHSKEDKQIYLEKSLRDFATLYHEATRYFAITFRSLSEATKDIEANGSRKYLDAINAKYLVETELLGIFYEWLCDLIAELKIYPSKEFIKECETNKNWKRLTHEINLLFDTGSICEPLPDEPADIVTPILLPPKDEATAPQMEPAPDDGAPTITQPVKLPTFGKYTIEEKRKICETFVNYGDMEPSPDGYKWTGKKSETQLALFCLCLQYGTTDPKKEISKIPEGTRAKRGFSKECEAYFNIEGLAEEINDLRSRLKTGAKDYPEGIRTIIEHALSEQ